MAICKSRNAESGKGARGMTRTREIEVGMWRIRAEMQRMGVGTLGIREIRVGVQGIRMILCENLRVYCFG